MIKDSFSWGQNVPMKVRLYVKIVQLELKEGTNCTPVGMNGFQRYKLNASNSQLNLNDGETFVVVSKSKEISLFAQSSKIFHAGFQPALTHRKLSRISLFSRKVS